MSMLKSIAIAGFKSFGAEANVPLGSLNVLIGANGSGKSNFLDAFSFLQAYGVNQIANLVAKWGGADNVLHFGTRHTNDVRFRIDFGDLECYTLTLLPTANGKIQTIFGYPIRNEKFPSTEEGKIKDAAEEDEKTKKRLSSWRQYHFHDTSFDSPMKKPSRLHDNRFLRESGSNLAPFLYLLREKHDSSYRLIQNTIRQVAPFFDHFSLEPAALNPDTIRLEWRHRNSDAYFDASSLSDGTLRFMALTTLLLQPAEIRPEIVLLDEPELGLHPYAIAMLAAMLRSASKETQIVVATQSPGLLDHFEPEDVLTAERVGGETRFNRLDAEPLREWLEDYSLGQLWEKNHFGGRPAREGADSG